MNPYAWARLSDSTPEDLLHERGIMLCQSEVTYFWSEERSQRGFFLLHSRNTT